MVLELIQSRFKGLNLNTECLKLSRVGVDLPRMLIIKNTNLIAEGSDYCSVPVHTYKGAAHI
jgi:hypothetical protein